MSFYLLELLSRFRKYVEYAEVSAIFDSRLRFTQSGDASSVAAAVPPPSGAAKATGLGALKDDWPRALYNWLMRAKANTKQTLSYRVVIVAKRIFEHCVPFAFWSKLLDHQNDWKRNMYQPGRTMWPMGDVNS